MSQNENAAKAQHELIGVEEHRKAAAHTSHPDAQWFHGAGLGLFLHWGISAVSGKVDLSWGMMADTTFDAHKANANKLTPNEYYRLAESFHPGKYDPKKWLKAAKEAGAAYAVLTTKHHDGYSLWPSEAGSIGVKDSLSGVDLVRPFVEACRELNLKVGLYYSPPDWYLSRETMSFRYGSGRPGFETLAHYDMDFQPVKELKPVTEELREKIRVYNRTQITELLTWYGKIDLIWFDGANEVIPITIEEIRSLQPGIVVNPRLHGTADYSTPECSMPQSRPEGWWELCHIWNCESWAYHESEAYKDLNWMLDLFCRTRAWDGNFLVNCAPNADGEMPETYYLRMEELKAWMEVNREAVFDVFGGDYPNDANVPYTVKGNARYFFVLPLETQIIRLNGNAAKSSAKLLETGETLTIKEGADGMMEIEIPQALRSGTVDVVCVTPCR